jgi:hypothetical protein
MASPYSLYAECSRPCSLGTLAIRPLGASRRSAGVPYKIKSFFFCASACQIFRISTLLDLIISRQGKAEQN